MRRLGSFNVVEIIVVSALMLGIKVINADSGRRRHEGSNKTFVMSDELAPMEFVGKDYRSASGSSRRARGNNRYRRRVRRTPKKDM